MPDERRKKSKESRPYQPRPPWREYSREAEHRVLGTDRRRWPRWSDLSDRWFWALIIALLIANIVFRVV